MRKKLLNGRVVLALILLHQCKHALRGLRRLHDAVYSLHTASDFTVNAKSVSFLPQGKPAEDEVKLGSLKLKPNTKIMMMGTREESLVGDWSTENLNDLRDIILEP